MTDKKADVKGSRLRIVCVVLWILFFVIAVQLFLKEGRYHHAIRIELTPYEREFHINVRVDGRSIRLLPSENGLEARGQVVTIGDSSTYVIKGMLQKEPDGKPVELRVLCDSDMAKANWKVAAAGGARDVSGFYSDSRNTLRFAYPLVMVIVSGMALIKLVTRRRGNQNPVLQVLSEIERDDSCREAYEAGKRWFLFYDRREYWNLALSLLLYMGNGLLMLHGVIHGTISSESLYGILALYAVIILAVVFFIRWYQAKKFNEMLLKELRPLTTAVACLMEALSGGFAGFKDTVAVQNAAAGLCRAGWYEEALCLVSAGREEKRERLYLKYCRSMVRYTCLYNLGREEEAEREIEIQRQILQKKPAFKRMEGVSACLQLVAIRKALRGGDRDRAWALTQVCLEQYRGDYYRLPFLGIQAMLEEEDGRTEEAEAVYQSILKFSPENMEVRRAAVSSGNYSCYKETAGLFRDTLVDAGRVILTAMGGFALFLSTAVSLQ